MRLVIPVENNIYMDHHGSMTGQTRRRLTLEAKAKNQESGQNVEKLVMQPMCIYHAWHD